MALMYNTRQVPAEWQIKPTTDHGDSRFFNCEPEQGLLPPGQKQLLKVWSSTYLESCQYCYVLHDWSLIAGIMGTATARA